MPLIKLKIGLDNGYPFQSAPKVEIMSKFYKKYEEKIIEALVSRWSPEAMVLYDWYSFSETDVVNEVF